MKLPILTAAALLVAGTASAEHLNIATDGARFKDDTITFSSVLMDKPGWIVVHAMEDGAPVLPQSVGATMIETGVTTDVEVMIDGGVMKDTGYMAMLHYETNGNDSYDFGVENTMDDGPATKADGSPYMTEFKTDM
ncbi:DUF7282 domain-containing protein [Profundibacterium mesophilum]|uniref:DUF7282 domain-containing protein n=1 Tax=Profundibacterium mesophilum KAUST100406-0324 TaxID=1037889 RepID=A0A921NTK4_9RHOB|nr:hypothetical protein [Profundibacterium mesophilum]KAF0675280.1 hypothetical protein PMES_02401 [Profundibacterium mesophilum KAUST100406-0324]